MRLRRVRAMSEAIITRAAHAVGDDAARDREERERHAGGGEDEPEIGRRPEPEDGEGDRDGVIRSPRRQRLAGEKQPEGAAVRSIEGI